MILGDKMYSDFEYFNDDEKQTQNIQMLTPVKASRGSPNKKNKRIKPITTYFLLWFLKSGNP